MFTYENGVVIGFVLWIITLIRALFLINSKTQSNLRKVGKRLSLFGGVKDIEYRKQDKLNLILKFIFIVVLPLGLIFLSWVYVIPTIVYYLYQFYQDFSAPQKVKDFRWKLKNLDLHQDQLIRWLMELSDQNPEDFEKIKKEINEDIERRKNA
ncbi:hypothetical protein [Acinetobacter baumannii]|uniref:hypothetical protein n=2 Tax=Acinetobacter baumannii TaxID=470 RepID=UPI000BD39C46|nr:hypothetical protein [Acinetobacter baumannii]MBC6789973.1 hypothetical protein [Acinetobacter baumannii]MBF1851329.1 hypothetical protein [Acinetobacter baumannii]MBS4735906.1 hypothetical protein [Acinetobacter baumannii]MCH1773978.1 hypothetical protein [Acinetobacter baumannii]MCR0003860.1 hypothetical protein [Acinetobacter baumannii]